MNRHEGWLAVGSCGYADFAEARASGARLQEALPITAAKQKVGVEFYLRGAVEAIHVYPGGQFELRDPGLPLPTILSDQELKEMVGAAVESATSLKTNQRVTAELLNDSFFKMSPEASFLVRVSAVEALCPQADQTENFRRIVDSVLASIPEDASALDRDQIKQALNRLAKRQSVRSAYKSKIKQLFGDDKADKFDALYGLRSNFLHDGSGRGSLGDAAPTSRIRRHQARRIRSTHKGLLQCQIELSVEKQMVVFLKWLRFSLEQICVYRKLKPERSDGEARRGSGVNE